MRHSVEVVTVVAVILLLSPCYSERIISMKNVVLTYPVQSTSFEELTRDEIIFLVINQQSKKLLPLKIQYGGCSLACSQRIVISAQWFEML